MAALTPTADAPDAPVAGLQKPTAGSGRGRKLGLFLVWTALIVTTIISLWPM